MDAYASIATFIAILAGVSWINARFFKLPSSVAMVLAGGLGAALLVALSRFGPAEAIAATLMDSLRQVDFPQAILQWMLGFLLFAGGLQVDAEEMIRRWLPVFALATAGVVCSMAVVALGVWTLAGFVGVAMPLTWAAVFGALISPSDPVAVMSATGRHNAFARLRTILQGEALFNDGVGIILFSAALAIATATGDSSVGGVLGGVLVQALGGAALGVVGGWLVIRAMGAIDDFAAEVMLSLALASAVYAIAQAADVSGPIGVAVAGLMIGRREVRDRLSDTTQKYLAAFWRLVKEMLEGALFLLLGLELAVATLQPEFAALAVVAILCVLSARLLLVVPLAAMLKLKGEWPAAGRLLFWGGMRGAISVALCLMIPAGETRDAILTLTFGVVLFSILVQGVAFGQIVKHLAPPQDSRVA